LILTLLGANTLACSCQRLSQLWQRRRSQRLHTNMLLLCPTLMHLCFLLILSGHALTEFSGAKGQVIVQTGQHYNIAATQLDVLDVQHQFHTSGVLDGYLQQSQVNVNLSRNGQSRHEQVQVLHPLWDSGISYHLALAGKAVRGEDPKLVINIKQDTGLPLILIGNGLMCLLLCFYFFFVRKQSRGENL